MVKNLFKGNSLDDLVNKHMNSKIPLLD
jgi:hypothetical protein